MSSGNDKELQSYEIIDRLCDRFEQSYRNQEFPRIEEYLEMIPIELRETLLFELLTIELELKDKSGHTVVLHEIESRFPDDTAIIDRAKAAVFEREKTYASPSMTQSEEPIRDQIGPYTDLIEIGRGGMGVVYRALQPQLKRVVALKTILSGKFASEEEIRRFHLEAESAAKLEHPGIVPIYDVGQDGEIHYFSMGFVQGEDLGKELKKNTLPPKRAAALLKQISDAVSYAHGFDVVHRDLKPANILITSDDQPKIMDFGLAVELNNDSRLTQDGQIIGTPSYMPPEQATGQIQNVDAISDVYSLGAILYCMLTGRPPFESSTIIETLRQVVNNEPVSPRLLNPEIDKDIETICLRCLSKKKKDRFASAADLSAELGRYLEGLPILSRPIGTVQKSLRWCRRHPARTTLIAFSILFLGITSVLSAKLQVAAFQSQIRQYYSLVAGYSDLKKKEIPGWTREAVKNIAEARKYLPDEEPLIKLRNQYIDAVTEFDGEVTQTLISGFEPDAICCSKDGRYIAVSKSKPLDAYSLKVHLIDLQNDSKSIELSMPRNALLITTTKKQDRPISLAFSPDGKLLACGSQGGAVSVWQISTPSLSRYELVNRADTLFGFGRQDGIGSLHFNNQSDILYAGSADSLFTFDIVTQHLKNESFDLDSLNLVGLVDDDSIPVLQSEHGLFMFNKESNKLNEQIASHPAKSLEIHPYQRFMYTCDSSGEIFVDTVVKNKKQDEWVSRSWPSFFEDDAYKGQSPHPFASQLSLSPEGNYLATIGESEMKIWDAANGKLLRRISIGATTSPDVRFHPKNSKLFYSKTDCVEVFSPFPREYRKVALGLHPIESFAYIPNNQNIVAIRRTLHEDKAGKYMAIEYPGKVGPTSHYAKSLLSNHISLSSDQKTFAIEDYRGYLVLLSNVENRLHKSSPLGEIEFFCFIKGSQDLIVQSDSRTVSRYNPSTDSKTWEWSNVISQAIWGQSRLVSFIEDGKYIYAAGEDGLIRCITIEEGIVEKNLEIGELGKVDLELTGNQQWIIAACSSGHLSFISAKGDRKRKRIMAHEGEIPTVAVSGDYVVTGGRDRIVKVWQWDENNVTLHLMFEFEFDQGIKKVAISQDAEWLHILEEDSRFIHEYPLSELVNQLEEYQLLDDLPKQQLKSAIQ